MTSPEQRYLNQVRRALCCPAAEKKRLLGGLEQELADAFADAPAPGWAELCERFGTPPEAARELARALPAGMAEAAARRGRRLTAGLLAALAAVVLAAGWAIRAERQRAEAVPPEVILIQPTPEGVYATPQPTPRLPVELPPAEPTP